MYLKFQELIISKLKFNGVKKYDNYGILKFPSAAAARFSAKSVNVGLTGGGRVGFVGVVKSIRTDSFVFREGPGFEGLGWEVGGL